MAATAAARASDISAATYPGPSEKISCPRISAAFAPESAVPGRRGVALSEKTSCPLKSRSNFASESSRPGTYARSGASPNTSWPCRCDALSSLICGARAAGPSSKTSWPEISRAFASEMTLWSGAGRSWGGSVSRLGPRRRVATSRSMSLVIQGIRSRLGFASETPRAREHPGWVDSIGNHRTVCAGGCSEPYPPREKEEPPPGGARTRELLRPVMKFPTFCPSARP